MPEMGWGLPILQKEWWKFRNFKFRLIWGRKINYQEPNPGWSDSKTDVVQPWQAIAHVASGLRFYGTIMHLLDSGRSAPVTCPKHLQNSLFSPMRRWKNMKLFSRLDLFAYFWPEYGIHHQHGCPPYFTAVLNNLRLFPPYNQTHRIKNLPPWRRVTRTALGSGHL